MVSLKVEPGVEDGRGYACWNSWLSSSVCLSGSPLTLEKVKFLEKCWQTNTFRRKRRDSDFHSFPTCNSTNTLSKSTVLVAAALCCACVCACRARQIRLTRRSVRNTVQVDHKHAYRGSRARTHRPYPLDPSYCAVDLHPFVAVINPI